MNLVAETARFTNLLYTNINNQTIGLLNELFCTLVEFTSVSYLYAFAEKLNVDWTLYDITASLSYYDLVMLLIYLMMSCSPFSFCWVVQCYCIYVAVHYLIYMLERQPGKLINIKFNKLLYVKGNFKNQVMVYDNKMCDYINFILRGSQFVGCSLQEVWYLRLVSSLLSSWFMPHTDINFCKMQVFRIELTVSLLMYCVTFTSGWMKVFWMQMLIYILLFNTEVMIIVSINYVCKR